MQGNKTLDWIHFVISHFISEITGWDVDDGELRYLYWAQWRYTCISSEFLQLSSTRGHHWTFPVRFFKLGHILLTHMHERETWTLCEILVLKIIFTCIYSSVIIVEEVMEDLAGQEENCHLVQCCWRTTLYRLKSWISSLRVVAMLLRGFFFVCVCQLCRQHSYWH